jgi:hypothetical protein
MPGPPCDLVTIETFPRSAYWRGFNGGFSARSNGFAASCGFVFPLSETTRVVAGYGAMTFVNSFADQSYALGVTLDIQHRFAAQRQFGVYGGVDLGIVHGYDGRLNRKLMVGAFTPAAQFKAGMLYDVPDTRVTLFGGVRIVPPVAGLPGTISPTVGLSYAFGPN